MKIVTCNVKDYLPNKNLNTQTLSASMYGYVYTYLSLIWSLAPMYQKEFLIADDLYQAGIFPYKEKYQCHSLAYVLHL